MREEQTLCHRLQCNRRTIGQMSSMHLTCHSLRYVSCMYPICLVQHIVNGHSEAMMYFWNNHASLLMREGSQLVWPIVKSFIPLHLGHLSVEC
jgi:hypothetical protein